VSVIWKRVTYADEQSAATTCQLVQVYVSFSKSACEIFFYYSAGVVEVRELRLSFLFSRTSPSRREGGLSETADSHVTSVNLELCSWSYTV